MSDYILRCERCKRFTMKPECSCGGAAKTVKPPKYSPDDPYARYRRQAKRSEYENKGLI